MNPERFGGLRIGSLKRVHIAGIAGSGLSGMARLLHSLGLQISGSEMKDSKTLQGLSDAGITCRVGHDASNIPAGTDLLVITAAIGDENPEVLGARQRGIPVLKYAQMVGLLMLEKKGIAIAGTHGKTTTTSMVASVLAAAGRDPGFMIGGEYPILGGSSRWGLGEHFVAEACEFDRSFLNFHPHFAVVTNIEEDHLDYFRSLAEIQEAFAQFVGQLAPEGHLVLNADDPHSGHLPGRTCACVGWFSLHPGLADWWAEAIEPAGGGIRFTARSAWGETVPVALRVPGIHNVKNALAAIAILRQIGLGQEEIAADLGRFTGARRRFEILLREPVTIVDDYAHHPTEIEAVLKAARETFKSRRIRLVFQPHQYSRTRRFLGRFAEVLARADETVVAKVYRARDSNEDVQLVDSETLVREIRLAGGRAESAPGFDDILEYLRENWSEGDVLICLGAGDINVLARRLTEEFASYAPESVLAAAEREI